MSGELQRRRRAVRLRMILTVSVVTAVVAGALAAVVYASVRDARTATLVEQSVRDAKLGVLLLPPDASPSEVPGLLATFAGPLPAEEATSDADPGPGSVVIEDRETYSSRPGLSATDIPSRVRQRVAAGRVTTGSVELPQGRHLVVGLPLTEPPRQLFVFYSQQRLVDQLRNLRFVLAAGWLAIVGASAGAGNLVARRQMAALADEHERQRHFAADVSHELQTPLAAMVTAASLLAEHLEALPRDARGPAELLVHDTRRLRRLVEDLLELSRLDAEGAAPARESHALAAVVQDTVTRFGPGVRVAVADPDARVAADPVRLARIAFILLDNAVTHGGGDVEVQVMRRGDHALLEVADQGPGIPREELPHVFARFRRGDGASPGGNGLGLAIASKHAQLMGGTIALDSAPGRGTRATLRLPLAGVGRTQGMVPAGAGSRDPR